ncbi:MAG: YitT family protein, partial [Erysipelotrichaceae bacterium]|nr:YitT family protein [Erysipelotrichaceae bacterium]
MKQRLLDIFFILLGNTIYACGIVFFVLPAKLVIGGTTGIGLSLQYYF